MPLAPCLALLAASVTTSPAIASDGGKMWGVGARIGTLAWPSAYPSKWPNEVPDDTNLTEARGDFLLGAGGLYYLNKSQRMGLNGTLDLGTGFRDANLMLKYGAIKDFDALDWVIGGGLGIGRTTWSAPEGDEALVISNYPLRLETGLMMRQKTWAVEALVFGQYALPGAKTYTRANGTEVDAGNWGFYWQLGLEVGFYYGDFKYKDSSKNKKKKNNKK